MLPSAWLLAAGLGALAASAGATSATDATRPTLEPAPATGTSAPAGLDYRIGPDDILKITVAGGVTGPSDETQTVVVQHDGQFSFPLLDRVSVLARPQGTSSSTSPPCCASGASSAIPASASASRSTGAGW